MFAAAIAEATETVTTTTTSTSVGFHMDIDMILTIVIFGFIIVQGLGSLFTGKVFGFGKSAQNYTDESLGAFARPWGVGQILMGSGLLLLDFRFFQNVKSTPVMIAGIACLVLAIVVMVLAQKKLVKKQK